jgi:hypothetical protein
MSSLMTASLVVIEFLCDEKLTDGIDGETDRHDKANRHKFSTLRFERAHKKKKEAEEEENTEEREK